MAKQTKEQFIEKAKTKHGNLYGYEKVVYLNSATKVIIRCLRCGEDFEQKPNNHLQGNGCPSCNRKPPPNKKTREEWLTYFKQEHGSKYDYSYFFPKNARDKSKVVCKRTGDGWYVSPDNHKKRGCPCCKGDRLSEMFSMPYEEAAAKMKQEHPHITITKEGYTKWSATGLMTCDLHGEFEGKIPSVFANQWGCPSCLTDAGIVNGRCLTKDEFLDRIPEKNKHLDFSKAVYTKSQDKVVFYCPKHDLHHSAKPNNIMNGNGCPECGKEIAAEKLTGFYNTTVIERNKETLIEQSNNVYLAHFPEQQGCVVKVGIGMTPKTRMYGLRAAFKQAVELVYTITTNTYDAFYIEKAIHEELKDFRYKGMKGAGHTEIFSLTEEQVLDVLERFEEYKNVV